MKLESLFQHLLHKSQCLFGLFRSLTKNHKVIGITNKPVTGVIQLPVQIVQNNICQEWGDDPTLWCADGNTPLSITPDVRNFSTRRRMLPSATRSATDCVMIGCERFSKETATHYPSPGASCQRHHHSITSCL